MNKDEKNKKKYDKDRDSLYREFIISYWNDSIVVDEFTKIDKHFYSYLLTNPHTNLIQCYQLSKKLVSLETDFSIDEINESIKHLEKLGFIKYDNETKEILLLKYVRDNWTTSEKYIKGLIKQLNKIQSESLISELSNSLENTRFKITNDSNTLYKWSIEGIETIDESNGNDNDTRKENDSNSEIEDRNENERIEKNSIKNLKNKELKELALKNSFDVNHFISFYDSLKANKFRCDESGEYIDSIESLVNKFNEVKEYQESL